ncbi:MAG TPA: diguanylate cyclase [Longimicrobium sp.]|nr:diguanylate cyclase [Longimicrobium sp.]
MQTAAPTHPSRADPAALRARALAVRHADPAAALELAEAALSAATARGDAAHERAALAVLGACLGDLPGQVERGRELLADALARAEAARDPALRCRVLNELAAGHAATYDFEAAERLAGEAAEAAQALGLRCEEAQALRIRGAVLTGRGAFAAALGVLLQALELREAVDREDAEGGDRWERAELFGRIAIVYSNMDQCGRALEYYRVALDALGNRYPLQTARTLYRMGIAADELRDGEGAETYYRECMELYQRAGDEAGAALGAMGLTKILLRRGDVAPAETLIRRALHALRDDAVHLGYYTDAVWVMGDVHMHHGRHAEALAWYQEAHSLFRRTERPPSHEAHLHRRFARVYAALGRFEEALRHHEQFHDFLVRQLEEQANARMAAMMVQFDTERAMRGREIHRLRSIELEREIAERKEAEAALARAQAELEARNRELHALTIRDPLTGAFNRRYLDQRLAEAMPLATRGVQPLSVMLCDVDDFKRVNDTFSHAVGDAVLRRIAEILRAHVRQSDVVARWGGEEFVVLFPATTLDQALAASEKVCALVRNHRWNELQPGLSVTISAGVAAAAGHATPEALLRDADARLYEAKARGKDCVVG